MIADTDIERKRSSLTAPLLKYLLHWDVLTLSLVHHKTALSIFNSNTVTYNTRKVCYINVLAEREKKLYTIGLVLHCIDLQNLFRSQYYEIYGTESLIGISICHTFFKHYKLPLLFSWEYLNNMQYKVNSLYFRENKSDIFTFVSLFNLGQFLMARICS